MQGVKHQVNKQCVEILQRLENTTTKIVGRYYNGWAFNHCSREILQ